MPGVPLQILAAAYTTLGISPAPTHWVSGKTVSFKRGRASRLSRVQAGVQVLLPLEPLNLEGLAVLGVSTQDKDARRSLPSTAEEQ